MKKHMHSSRRQNILLKNITALEGEGELANEFKNAVETTHVHSGCLYLEALVDDQSGEIVQFLSADPKRIYQQKLFNHSGVDITIGGILSLRNPKAKLVTFTYSVHTKKISSVTSHQFFRPVIMGLLQETMAGFNAADFSMAA